jgi:hypothetical protein
MILLLEETLPHRLRCFIICQLPSDELSSGVIYLTTGHFCNRCSPLFFSAEFIEVITSEAGCLWRQFARCKFCTADWTWQTWPTWPTWPGTSRNHPGSKGLSANAMEKTLKMFKQTLKSAGVQASPWQPFRMQQRKGNDI